MKKVILGMALSALLLGACKKDKKTDPETPMALLTVKPWRPALVDKNPATNPANGTLYYAALNCEMDDTYQFNANKKLTFNRGNSKCDADETAQEMTDYNLDVENGNITIKGIVYVLEEISATQLKYSFPTNSSGTVNNIVFIFEH